MRISVKRKAYVTRGGLGIYPTKTMQVLTLTEYATCLAFC